MTKDKYYKINALTRKDSIRPTYVELMRGFNILMEYWDSIPDGEKRRVDKRLKAVNC